MLIPKMFLFLVQELRMNITDPGQMDQALERLHSTYSKRMVCDTKGESPQPVDMMSRDSLVITYRNHISILSTLCTCRRIPQLSGIPSAPALQTLGDSLLRASPGNPSSFHWLSIQLGAFPGYNSLEKPAEVQHTCTYRGFLGDKSP